MDLLLFRRYLLIGFCFFLNNRSFGDIYHLSIVIFFGVGTSIVLLRFASSGVGVPIFGRSTAIVWRFRRVDDHWLVVV